MENSMFTYFKRPIKNTMPFKDITLGQLHKMITTKYQEATEAVRAAESKEAATLLKVTLLDYVTVGGTFSKRSNKNLIEPSGFLTLDIDDVYNPETKKKFLLEIDCKYPIAFMFTSPRGRDLKVVVEVENDGKNFSELYKEVDQYFESEYAITLDNTSDIARACFVCFDPNAWINEVYMN